MNKKLTIVIVALFSLCVVAYAFSLKLPYILGDSLTVTRGYDTGSHINKDKYALDFAADTSQNTFGKSVLAASGGEILAVNNIDTGGNGYGFFVKVKAINGSIEIYAHLSSVENLSASRAIKQGQIIGKIGNTGYVEPAPTNSNDTSGSHLHFSMYEKRSDGT
ncbi:MAG: M23 family metallopeptidase, partial [Patescibacteria group bacterium]